MTWPRRRSKFNARLVKLDGFTFQSAAEARRYGVLKLLQANHQIVGLLVHPPFRLIVNKVHVANYVGDFLYFLPDGTRVVEDVKGVKTPIYRLKKKLMRACLGIEIQEVH